MRIAESVQDAMVAAAGDETDVGTGTAVLEIYTGAAPGAIGGAPPGDLLLSFDLPDPAFGAPAAGVITLQGVPISATGVGDGTASYARFVNQNGDAVYDTEDVGTSGNTVEMSTTTVSTGLDVDVTGGTLAVGTGTLT